MLKVSFHHSAREGNTHSSDTAVVRHSTKPSDPTLPELKEHIDQLMESVDKATGQPVAFTLTPLDCRMGQVRTEESATGNLISDILMHSYEDALREKVRTGVLKDERPEGMRQVDMTLMCGGSIRGDAVFGPGSEYSICLHIVKL